MDSEPSGIIAFIILIAIVISVVVIVQFFLLCRNISDIRKTLDMMNRNIHKIG